MLSTLSANKSIDIATAIPYYPTDALQKAVQRNVSSERNTDFEALFNVDLSQVLLGDIDNGSCCEET
jgi:hypothetical protein